jgi:multiple sugar transport system ATP-binding protein
MKKVEEKIDNKVVAKVDLKAEAKAAKALAKKGEAFVSLRHIDKVYDNNVQAVFDFNLDIKRKEFIVFVGPSGCGKSTTLRMIAGLEDITAGELYIDGEYANDKSPKDRDIAMVFQSYALYPHMTVYDNMAFGLKIRHYPKAEIDRRVKEAAAILQITEYLDRKPKALSGGQRQRVALGRAVVRNAKVFLMDEPLSNLDAKLRVQMRSEIIKLTEALEATTIYVTHDQTEAMTMATRIVVMKLGYIQQIGSPIEIYNHPVNLFVAGFIGSPAMNFINAKYDKGIVTLQSGTKITMGEEFVKGHDSFYHEAVKELTAKVGDLTHSIEVATEQAKPKLLEKLASAEADVVKAKEALVKEHEIVFGLRPEDIHEGDAEHITKYGNTVIDVEVSVAELLGHEYLIHSEFAGIDLVAKISSTHLIYAHDKMKLVFDIKKAHCFDKITTNRIY